MDALMTNVYVNSECTRSCKYCYYPKNGSMNKEVAMDLSTWIRGVCAIEHVHEYKAHFLGGEPLLNTKILYQLMDDLYDLPGHPDGKFVIFTNGDLLNDEVLNQLKRRHARIMLNPTDHNMGWVDSTMKYVKKNMGGISLAVVADDVNLPRLSELATLAVKYEGHIRVNRLYHGGTIPGYCDRFGEAMHKVFDVLLAAPKPMWPNFILESTYPLWEGPKNCHACGKWFLVFDPNGDIRSCNGDMETKVGSIYTTEFKDIKFPHRWSSKNLEDCKGCEWANGGWCQGGCPLSRKLTWGHYNKETPFCFVYKTLFPRLKELTEKWKRQHAPTPQV